MDFFKFKIYRCLWIQLGFPGHGAKIPIKSWWQNMEAFFQFHSIWFICMVSQWKVITRFTVIFFYIKGVKGGHFHYFQASDEVAKSATDMGFPLAMERNNPKASNMDDRSYLGKIPQKFFPRATKALNPPMNGLKALYFQSQQKRQTPHSLSRQWPPMKIHIDCRLTL